MPITLVALTCRAVDPNGNPVVGAIYRAELNRADSEGSIIIAPEVLTAKSDVNGIAVFQIWPNALGITGSAYKIEAINPDTRRRFVDGYIVVPNAPTELEDILILPAAPVAPAGTGVALPASPADLSAARDRATHTGTQAVSTIAGFEAAVQAVPGFGTGTAGTVAAVQATAPLVVGGTANTPLLSIPAASATTAGTMAVADKTKLDAVAAGATANATDALLRTRSTHTGTQLSSTISDFASAVSTVVGASGGGLVEAVLELNYTPTLTIDLAGARRNFKVTMDGDMLLANPTGSAEGKNFQIAIKRGAAGVLTFGDRWTTEVLLPSSFSQVIGSIDLLRAYDSGADGIRTVSVSLGPASGTAAPGPPNASFPEQAFNFESIAQKGAWLETQSPYLKNGTAIVTTVPNTISEWVDRSPNLSSPIEALSANYQNFRITNGVANVECYNNFVSPTGGSGQTGIDQTKGFFWIERARPLSYNTTLWSDVDTVNTGRYVRWSGAGVAGDGRGDFQFSVGVGTGRATVRSVPGQIVTDAAHGNPINPPLISCRHDVAGGMLYMTVDGITTSAPVTGTFAPGTAGYAFAGSTTATYEINTCVYQHLHVYHQLDATVRAGLRTYFGEVVAATPAPAPTPTPAGGFSIGWASLAPKTGYAAGVIGPTNFTQAQQDAHCVSQYNVWKSKLVTGMGGRYNPFNGIQNEVVSEGIGYGMMIAVIFAGYDATAKAIFDDHYNIAKTHPAYRLGETSLMEWKLKDDKFTVYNGVTYQDSWTDPNGGNGWNAVDGDEDIAFALLMADRQWGSAGTINYKADAIKVINRMKARNFRQGGFWPGSSGGVGTPHLSRTSDYMIGHFRAYRRATGDAYWDTAVNTSFALFERCQTVLSPTAKLVPDFLIYMDTANPIADNLGLGDGRKNELSGCYFWNGCRIPWRLGTDYVMTGDVRSRTVGSRIVDYFIGKHGEANPGRITGGYRMNGSELNPTSTFHPHVFITTLAPAACGETRFQTYLNNVWTTDTVNPEQGYYGLEIGLLSAVVAAGRWWDPL